MSRFQVPYETGLDEEESRTNEQSRPVVSRPLHAAADESKTESCIMSAKQSRYVAFLRGINLGKRRATKDELCSAFESAGFQGVDSFLASGNVIFDATPKSSAALEARIEETLLKQFGFEVDTFVRSMSALEELAATNPVVEADRLGWNLHVFFLKDDAPSTANRAFKEIETADDKFAVIGREAYWLRNGRMTDSAVSQKDISDALGKRTNTARNYNTVERIIAKYA